MRVRVSESVSVRVSAKVSVSVKVRVRVSDCKVSLVTRASTLSPSGTTSTWEGWG